MEVEIRKMKVDFGLVLKTLDEQEISLNDGTNENKDRKLTLGVVCIESLLANVPLQGNRQEPQISGEEKLRRYDLAVKIKGEQEMEITAEEVSLIKKLVGERYGTLVVGQAWKMLEGGITKKQNK